MRRSTPGVLAELKAGGLTLKTKFALSVAAFNRISQYDGAISDYLSSLDFEKPTPPCPRASSVPGPGQRPLRQAAGPALRREPAPAGRVLPRPVPGTRLAGHREAVAGQGAELQQHRRCRCGLGMRQELRRTPACVIVKHANPCGVAVGADALEAYSKAFQTDPTSAFGGIIAFNCTRGRRRGPAGHQAVRRGADGAGLHARGAGSVQVQGQRAHAADRPAARRRHATGTTAATPWTSSASAPAC